MEVILGGIFLIGFGLFLWYLKLIYNQFISVHKRVTKYEQNIDVAVTQRNEELTKLCDVIQTHMDYESPLLQEITSTRTAVNTAETLTEEADADNQVQQLLYYIQVQVEEYPELQAINGFEHLLGRVQLLEEKLANRRTTYNEAVTIYNTRLNQIPYIISKLFGYTEKELFKQD